MLEEIKRKLSDNPYQFDLFKQYIDILPLDEKERARGEMKNYFAFSPDMWFAWIRDSVDSKRHSLYLSALEEQPSSEVLNFCISDALNENSRGNLNDNDWIMLFDKFINIFTNDPSLIHIPYYALKEANKLDEVDILKSLLSIPHCHHESTFNLFKAAISDQMNYEDLIWDLKKNGYNKAVDIYNGIDVFEMRLKNDINDWVEYFDYLKHKKLFDRAIMLLNRVLCENYLSEELWETLILNLNTDDMKVNAFRRATLNVTWSVNLWVSYAKMLEGKKNDPSGVEIIYKNALLGCLSAIVSTSDIRGFSLLLQSKCAFHRRCFKNHKDENMFRDQLQTAIHLLETYFPIGDPLFQLHLLIVKYEAVDLMNVANARKIFNSLLKKHSSSSYLWERFIEFEKIYSFSSIETKVSSLYRRALGNNSFKTLDYSENLLLSWQLFDDQYQGTNYSEISGIRQKIYANRSKSDIFKGNNQLKRKDREQSSNDEESDRLFKEPKAYYPTDPSKIPFTVFISNLPDSVNEKLLKENLSDCGYICDIRIVRDKRPGKEKTYSYVEFSNRDSVDLALKKDRCILVTPEEERCIFISRFQAKEKKYLDHRYKAFDSPTSNTLFIKMVPSSFSVVDLEKIFKRFGECKVFLKDSKSDGHKFAFVEFSQSEDAKRGLEVNGMEVGEECLKMNVAFAWKPKTTLKPLGYGGRGGKSFSRLRNSESLVHKSDMPEIPGESMKTNEEFRKLLLK